MWMVVISMVGMISVAEVFEEAMAES